MSCFHEFQLWQTIDNQQEQLVFIHLINKQMEKDQLHVKWNLGPPNLIKIDNKLQDLGILLFKPFCVHHFLSLQTPYKGWDQR
jgi:hypothetical protein